MQYILQFCTDNSKSRITHTKSWHSAFHNPHATKETEKPQKILSYMYLYIYDSIGDKKPHSCPSVSVQTLSFQLFLLLCKTVKIHL